MRYELIYLFTIILVTIFAIYYYMKQQYKHKLELIKIEKLETKYNEKRKRLEEERSRTIACPISNLKNPRDCYFKSGFNCSWNERAARCDKKN